VNPIHRWTRRPLSVSDPGGSAWVMIVLTADEISDLRAKTSNVSALPFLTALSAFV
jgi:hypothetical protein